MTSRPKLETHGVALLATRMSVLGYESCGGSEVIFWEDAAILKSAGIPVRVYGRSAREGSPVHVLPVRTRMPLLSSIEYGGQFLRKERHALIVAYNEPALAGWAPERTIVRFDWSTGLPRYWKWPFWLSRFQRALYVFPSESERRLFLCQHDRIPAHRAWVVPNAVDLRLFRPVDSGGTIQLANALRIGFAGQWVPGKGIDLLLDAWQSVKTTFPRAELHLAGGARLWKGTRTIKGSLTCATRIQEMEKEGSLQVIGSLPRGKMPDFWRSLNIAVVPSLYESFGLVALEAMACGVPVIATAVGGLKEIVQDGESGLLVPPGDAFALARALTTLLTNEPLRCRLAKGARQRAKKFSFERRSDELLQLLVKQTEGTT